MPYRLAIPLYFTRNKKNTEIRELVAKSVQDVSYTDVLEENKNSHLPQLFLTRKHS